MHLVRSLINIPAAQKLVHVPIAALDLEPRLTPRVPLIAQTSTRRDAHAPNHLRRLARHEKRAPVDVQALLSHGELVASSNFRQVPKAECAATEVLHRRSCFRDVPAEQRRSRTAHFDFELFKTLFGTIATDIAGGHHKVRFSSRNALVQSITSRNAALHCRCSGSHLHHHRGALDGTTLVRRDDKLKFAHDEWRESHCVG
mmetsp:Transcript_25649/g.84450  ORF Transcript_25649/g.84450 Transcript_25649/m.84450 type:complete len:201 (-) Transcript_25649:481-1083(-)